MKRLFIQTQVVMLFVVGMFIAPLAVKAADGPVGLQVSPAIIEINAEKGKTYDIKIKITNTTTSDQEYYANINDFKAKDETGNPEFITDAKASSNASIVQWIQPIAKFSLNPNQSKEIIAKMAVPANAEPGGHYGIIRFGNQPATTGQVGASLAASAGPLVLVRVDGEVKESLTVADFYTQHKGKKQSFFEYGPVDFVERLTNNGNVHVKPKGDIVVTNMLGRQVGSVKVNDNNGNVLPNSTRRFEQRLENKWMFGKYTAKMTLSYGTAGGALDAVTTFWVIPYKLIALLLLIVIFIIFALKKAIARYKKNIIEKALKAKQKDQDV